MEPVRKAVWYIEAHLAEQIELQDIASSSGMSKYHLSRIFAQFTGMSITSYLRGRRVTEAVRYLVEGKLDILNIALAVGYNSHEAFSRAFRTVFGVTPASVRSSQSADHLDLVEPFNGFDVRSIQLAEPEIREEGPFILAGIREFRAYEELSEILSQWRRFAPYIESVGRENTSCYGVCFVPSTGEEGFDYMTCLPVGSIDDVEEGHTAARIKRRRYAVFKHNDHISSVGAACTAIFTDWLPNTDCEVEIDPLMLMEHYDKTLNIETGRGGIEIWIPLKV